MILLLNYENALLQPNLTARAVIASGLGIPDDWVNVIFKRTEKGMTTETSITPPPDGRTIAPNARFFAMTQAEVTETIANVMKAARVDRDFRVAELDVIRVRGR